MPHRTVALSFWECNLAIDMEDTMPFRPNAQVRQESNPLRIDVTVAHRQLFRRQESEVKNFLPWLMVTNPYLPTIPRKEAKRPRGQEAQRSGAIISTFKRKKNNYRERCPLSIPFFHRVSMCRSLGQDTQDLIFFIAVRRVDVQCDMSTGWARAMAEG